MILTLISFFLAIVITLALVVMAWIISLRTSQDREKSSPFECGFDPKGSARLPFSLRFFLLAVVFLIFDLEIVLLLPAPVMMNITPNPVAISALITFILILLLGLFHEWREGSLNWAM